MSGDVDISYDVPTVGIYNRRGKVFIDRTAARELTPREVRDIVIHERIEHSKRVSGMPYEPAHEQTQQLFPFDPELKTKLHHYAGVVRQRVLVAPHKVRLPPDVMSAGATSDEESGGEQVDPIEQEFLKRKLERGDIISRNVEDMSDSEVNDVMDSRGQKAQFDKLKDRAKGYTDVAKKVGVTAIDKTQEYAEARMQADLAGRANNSVDPQRLTTGTKVVPCPRPLVCPRCKSNYPVGAKVFQKILDYQCPRCGSTLQKPAAAQGGNPLDFMGSLFRGNKK